MKPMHGLGSMPNLQLKSKYMPRVGDLVSLSHISLFMDKDNNNNQNKNKNKNKNGKEINYVKNNIILGSKVSKLKTNIFGKILFVYINNQETGGVASSSTGIVSINYLYHH
ncbi:unnamed protein product [marine sediment metagenome]|uniref:Uncharacterized protein n=1 Tax=marine sediment metagenome TaxID=412755 RepID=X1B1V0_9ZZZZ